MKYRYGKEKFAPIRNDYVEAQPVMLVMGLCECGCGQPTRIATKTDRGRAQTRGEPLRFIDGHNTRGARNPFWKGGTSVYVPAPAASDRQGVTWEHQVIAARALGKPLPPKAVIHHVNGNPRDNSPGNLVICENQGYHLLLHKRQRALDKKPSYLFVICSWCDRYLGTKEGSGISHGICPKCAARFYPELAP